MAALWFAIGCLMGLFFGVVLGLLGAGFLRAADVAPVSPVAQPSPVIVQFPAASAVTMPEPERGSASACASCGKPPNPLRTHDGRYLCSACKGAA